MLSDNLVAVASYEYDSADSPLVPAGHELFGSLSWIRDDQHHPDAAIPQSASAPAAPMRAPVSGLLCALN